MNRFIHQFSWRPGFVLFAGFVLATLTAWAEPSPILANPPPGQLVKLITRSGVNVPVFLVKQDQALATVLLLPGGSGGMGNLEGGWPNGRNFLVRSAALFAQAGFHVAIMSRPSDQTDMDYPFRVSSEHLQDLQFVVHWLSTQGLGPVWLVGTSRGSVSATAYAVSDAGGQSIAGVVLSSSVISADKIGAVPTQNLSRIKVPVLVAHHRHDACRICQPSGVQAIVSGLTQAPRKDLMWFDGGGPPQGNPCEALHHHGFIGIEPTVVQAMTGWIQKQTRTE